MAKTAATNYTGGLAFNIAGADSDAFDRTDLSSLATAVDLHTHTSGKGLAVLDDTQHEVEWATTPVIQQVASAAATNLTAGSVTPTFPAGTTITRVLLMAYIHVANQAANTHHISLKVQGQKAAGGYSDKIDLTAQTTIGLINLAGATDNWCGAVDVTTLVDTSAVAYDFRFVVDSDNAGAVNYTHGFILTEIYAV